METTQDPDILDKQKLNFSIETRETIIKELVKDGYPKDTDNQGFLIKLLDGMDRTILTRSKIKNDQLVTESQKNITAIMANVLTRISAYPTGQSENKFIDLDPSIIVTDPVEGEKDMGKQQLDYQEFFDHSL